VNRRIVIVTNGPAPYRIPALNELAALDGIDLHVVFCCRREPNRNWNLPAIRFNHTYLRERITTLGEKYIHNNPEVIPALKRLRPDIVITSGFNPTHLYAFAYARLRRIPHVAMTDGTYESERSLSRLHRWLRQLVYARSAAFLSASAGGKKLFASYGIADHRCFRACLCVENTRFPAALPNESRRFDFIFCGRLEPAKNPHFALDVALAVARKLKRKTHLLFVGDGSEEPGIRQRAALCQESVATTFHGFASQEELPALYRSARLFLFPTRWDVWGVVANEACAAGLPVLVSPYAGVAGELVLDGQNGYIRDLDVRLWADRAVELLTRTEVQLAFGERSRALVSQFTFKHACDGIAAACRYAAGHGLAAQ
jgi:glycosyltransferase involved in cell wall biosynthesis